MKMAGWLGVAVVVLGAASSMTSAQSADPMEGAAQKNEVVGTITNIDGMVYSIQDLRGVTHEFQMQPGTTAWGSSTVGSEVKALVEEERITELINLDD